VIMQGAIVRSRRAINLRDLHQVGKVPLAVLSQEYGVKMEEDVLCCDRILQSILPDVNTFFNVNYKIETLKAIPRGQGVCLRRLYKLKTQEKRNGCTNRS